MKKELPDQHSDSDLKIAWSALISFLTLLKSGPITIVSSMTGFEYFLDNQAFDKMVKNTSDYLISPAQGIIRLRELGFSDEMIACVFLGFAGMTIATFGYSWKELSRMAEYYD